MDASPLPPYGVIGHQHVCVNGRWSCRVWRRWRPKRKVLAMGVYTKRHGSEHDVSSGGRFAATDAEMAEKFPALIEFLTEALDEAGKVRVTSTLLVSCEDGRWKVCLVDRAQLGGKFDYKLWVSGDTLYGALKALDDQLQDGSAEWRRFPKWEAPKKR